MAETTIQQKQDVLSTTADKDLGDYSFNLGGLSHDAGGFVVSHMLSAAPVSLCSQLSGSSSSSVSSDGEQIMKGITKNAEDKASQGRSKAGVTLGFGRRTKFYMRDSNGRFDVESSQRHTTKRKSIARKVSESTLEVDVGGTSTDTTLTKKQKLNDFLFLTEAGSKSTAHPTSSASVAPGVRLLGSPDDGCVLNPLHVFIRMQIEVFTATPADLAMPAPGRKRPIRVGQVGLRCIHCKSSKTRVKRAICFPSSVGRVYHSVSDMKFDHFPNCKGMTGKLRAKFDALKELTQSKRSKGRVGAKTNASTSSSTAQYYHDVARLMGMQDARGGIFMGDTEQQQPALAHAPITRALILPTAATLASTQPPVAATNTPVLSLFHPPKILQPMSTSTTLAVPILLPPPAVSPLVAVAPITASEQGATPALIALSSPSTSSKASVPIATNAVKDCRLLLASPIDAQYLNPLHCFVRRNVELFAATRESIAEPSPGRKTRLSVGQVGIRCIHCVSLPPKQRVKRAVCYPPSIGGIYHSVSNMKFDHFAKCKSLPEAVIQEFVELRSSCARRGVGGVRSHRGGMSNSTAQYYHDSAMRMGLVDTESGIRFAHHVEPTIEKVTTAAVPGVSDGPSALMMAATTNSTVSDGHKRRTESGGESVPLV